ncbi:hypothetical protein FJY93_00185 [Candidatus Kaiserbacteria bacterium]|nr:hypothetical protein [Candidatus Kaiserbacteria bacterium]
MNAESRYLHGLNERQKEAVLHTEGPLLIIAGAGAGKTKTITHRIAHMIEQGVPARQILAVTFTNKAAGEMRERVKKLIPEGRGVPLVATFHSLGVRLLREFHEEAGLERGFSIWDRDDSMRVIKRALEKLNIETIPGRNVLSAISRAKGDGISREEYDRDANSFHERTVAQVWQIYDKALHEEGALDFDDLLGRTLMLLQNSPRVLELLRGRWHYITIDEYQDTNAAQYEIARLLSGERRNLCVVGDIDQCVAEGTLITMADGEKKPIERVKKGDLVLSNYGSGAMRPSHVHRIHRRSTRETVTITTKSGRRLTTTSDHVHFAGYRLGIVPQMYFTYLMYKHGVGYRLGVSQVYANGQRTPMVGFQQRCNHEHGDAVWIIGTHTASNDARVMEYTLSLQYQIPTLPFVARKGVSVGGYVHDQRVIDALFATIDTEKGAFRLLRDRGLSRDYPHHRAQSRDSNRRNVTITLCGDQRGKTPMHRISMTGNDDEGKHLLQSIGLSVRSVKNGSSSWRFESAHADYAALRERVMHISTVFPRLAIIENARLGGNKANPKDGNSLGFLPAASVLPGMALFDEVGGYDIITGVEKATQTRRVYDIDIEHTHNFIANGIITHNSIYTWRGADIEHLMNFETQFPGTKVILLEQNYRSTRTILTAANAVIAKNKRRKEKNLFTDNDTGEPIHTYAARNEMDESWFVAQTAVEMIQGGIRPDEIAILYRENFQSRALEEALLAFSVPYRVLGTKFFERKEVKDTLSYLRAALNPKSKVDLVRVAAVPPRGIGKVTLDKMLAPLEKPDTNGFTSIWDQFFLTGRVGDESSITGATLIKVTKFREQIAAIRKAIETLPASEAVRYTVEVSGMEKMYQEDKKEGIERLENIHELVNLAVRYDEELPPVGIEKLLEEAALQSDQDELEEPQAAVSLMTIHASKGLEFDAVFVTGLEQGLFPSLREDTRDPEEERRLFYVAVTRARKRLFLSHAGERMKYGSRERALRSEFIHDIDQRLIVHSSRDGGVEGQSGEGIIW